MLKHWHHLCKYEAKRTVQALRKESKKQRQQSSLRNSRIWIQSLGSPKMKFLVALIIIWGQSRILRMLLLRAQWAFWQPLRRDSLLEISLRMGTSTHVATTLYHKLSPTLAHSQRSKPGFYLNKSLHNWRTLWWLCTSPPTKVVSRNLSDQCAKDNFPSIHRQSAVKLTESAWLFRWLLYCEEAKSLRMISLLKFSLNS